MDLIAEIIKILIQLFTDPAGISALGIISAVAMILLLLLGKYVPSSKFRAWGLKAGTKITTKGNSFKYLKPGIYEDIETSFVGSLKAFVDGLYEGLDSDEEK